MTDINSERIAEYSPIEAGLAELRTKYQGVVFDVTTGAGLDVAKKARAEIRAPRYEIERKRTELKAPALAYAKRIDEEARRITAEILAIEEPIDKQIKAEEQRKEREREERAAAELKRVTGIQSAIAMMRELAVVFASKSAEEIDRAWNGLQDLEVNAATFEEFVEQAHLAKADTLVKLNELYKAALAREEEAARLKAEREELARQRAELDAQRKAAEQERAQREAAEKAERDAREAAERAEREAEQAKLRAEQESLRQEREKLDRQRQAQEAEAKRQAEAKDAELRKAEALRWQRELDERLAAERKQRAQAGVDVVDLVAVVSHHYAIDAEDAERWIIEAAQQLTAVPA